MNNFHTLKPYDSSESDGAVESDEAVECDEVVQSDEVAQSKLLVARKPKKKRTNQVWLKDDLEFETSKEAKDYINSLGVWKSKNSYNTEKGKKVTYRCTSGTYRKKECLAQLYLLYHSDSLRVSLYRNDNEHANHGEGNRGLQNSTRTVVKELFNKGITKPSKIIAALKNRNIEEPNKFQLSNFLATLRKSKYVPPTISIDELLKWSNERRDVPESEDQVFVLDIIAEVSEIKQELGIAMSTKRLLRLAIQSDGVQSDATYKLKWQGYPVLIVGTSDKNGLFHPIAISICYGERSDDYKFIFNSIKETIYKIYGGIWSPSILLADASDAISNGFEIVFGPPVRRLTCYSHVKKEIEKHLKEVKDDIKSDIEVLHLCPDDDSFNVVSNLFLIKWSEKGDDKIKKFTQYFERTWLETNRYWYEGACSNFLSTNDGLEAINATIKRQLTFQEHLPVSKFLSIIESSILKLWSSERDPISPNFKQYASTPEYTTNLWTETYCWVKQKNHILELKLTNKSIFYITPKSSPELTFEMIAMDNNRHLKWTSMDDYKASIENPILKVTVNGNDARCLCPVFLKKYVCKHSLGILVILDRKKVPDVAKNIPICQK